MSTEDLPEFRVVSMEGQGVRVDLFMSDDIEHAILATTYGDGSVETGFTYERSAVPFYHYAGCVTVDTPPSERAVALAAERYPRAREMAEMLREVEAFHAQRRGPGR